jgi:chemotaxis protein CheX
MHLNIVNPFMSAITEVMPQLGFQDIKRGKRKLSERTCRGIKVIVGLTKQIRGNVAYNMTTEAAIKSASTMMMGMPVENFDELAQSAISELTNMITANVATNFSRDNININISTPTLVHGKFTANASSDKVVCVQMEVENMVIDVNISMEKNTI